MNIYIYVYMYIYTRTRAGAHERKWLSLLQLFLYEAVQMF